LTNLKYICKGEGKPLVLLHGYLSCKESFVYQINYFSKFFKVYAIDLSGFGENEPLKTAYSLDDYIKDLLEFVNEKNLTNFHLIAHSFGARLVLKSRELRTKIDKLVLTGGAGLKPKRTLKYYFKVYEYKFVKKFFPHSKKLNSFGSSEYKTLSNVMKLSYTKIVNEHLDSFLNSVSNKTLIINGELDKTTPKYMAKKMHKRISGSSLVFIKKAGHFAFIDKANQFNYIVQEFLLG